MTDALAASERAKYEAAWTGDAYREQCDGLPVVGLAFERMGCVPGETLIDWGCGSGQATAAFARLGLGATGFDIAPNCLDADVRVPLVLGSMWAPSDGLEADYAFCTDVLEHLPPDKLGAAMDAIARRTRKAAFIQVDTVVDQFGDRMLPPQRLHLSVYWPDCWRGFMADRWRIVEDEPGSYSRWRFLCRK